MTCYVVPLLRSRDRKSPEKKKRTFKDAMREKIIQDHKEGKAQIDLDAVRKHSECKRVCLRDRRLGRGEEGAGIGIVTHLR